MPFNTLLTANLQIDTSFCENGTTISLKPEKGEKILFFRIDSKDKNVAFFKKNMGIKGENQPICDLIIYYLREVENNIQKIICFAEGKGGETGHGVEQILNTYNAFLKRTKDTNGAWNDIKWTAYIRINDKSSSHKDIKQLKKKLIQNGLQCDISRNNIDYFIRNIK